MKKATKNRKAERRSKMTCRTRSCSCSGGGYFLGFLGAAIYYISTATGFWNGVLGFLKAIIWPLFLVLEVLRFVGA